MNYNENINEDDLKKELQIIENQLIKEPQNLNLLFHKADIHYLISEYEQALETIQQILNIEPNNLSALFKYAILKGLLNEVPQAVKILEDLYAIAPNNMEILISLIKNLQKMDDYESAEKYVEKLLSLDPDVNGLIYCSLFYKDIGELDKAIPLAERTVQKEPKNSLFLSHLASLYNYDGQFEKAIQTMKKALKNDPNNVYFLLDYANYLSDVGDYKQALKTLQKAQKLEPQNPYVYSELSKFFAYINQDYSQALYSIDRAIELHDIPDFHFQKGIILMLSQKYMEAIHEYDEYLQNFPDDPLALSHKAQCLTLIGKYIESNEILLSILEIFPYDLSIQTFLAYNYFKLHNIEKANEWIKSILNEDKDFFIYADSENPILKFILSDQNFQVFLNLN